MLSRAWDGILCCCDYSTQYKDHCGYVITASGVRSPPFLFDLAFLLAINFHPHTAQCPSQYTLNKWPPSSVPVKNASINISERRTTDAV